MSGRCSLACRVSGAMAAALSLVVTACTSAPDRSPEPLAFEPGEAPIQPASATLGIDSPLRQICASPGGRALIDREMPGLTARPEYPMFSNMNLVQLKRMSGGRITDQDVARVATALRSLSGAAPPTRIATRVSGPQSASVTTTGPGAP